MSSTIFFFIFVPFLALILLLINLIFAPHNPYQEKESAFECGFHSFLGQNRTQFSISFFIFALLFLLFDLEILLVYPYIVSAYTNSVYGLFIMLMFFIALTIGLGFELGKKALNIDSRQVSMPDFYYISEKAIFKPKIYKLPRLFVISPIIYYDMIYSRISYLNMCLSLFFLWLIGKPIHLYFIIFIVKNLFLCVMDLDLNLDLDNGLLYALDDAPVSPAPDSDVGGGNGDLPPADHTNDDSGNSDVASPADHTNDGSGNGVASSASGSESDGSSGSSNGGDSCFDNNEHSPARSEQGGYPPEPTEQDPVQYDHNQHSLNGGSCLENPKHDSDGFTKEWVIDPVTREYLPPAFNQDTVLKDANTNDISDFCCKCGVDTINTMASICDVCGCIYHSSCIDN